MSLLALPVAARSRAASDSPVVGADGIAAGPTPSALTPDPTVLPGLPGLPGPPSSMLAVRGDGGLTLSWAPPSTGSSVTGYVVDRVDAGGVERVCTLPAHEPLCELSGLSNGTRYEFRVAAIGRAGVGRPVTVVAVPCRPVTFAELPDDLTTPAGAAFTLTASVDADPAASLVWQASRDGGRSWRDVGAPLRATSISHTEQAVAPRPGPLGRLRSRGRANQGEQVPRLYRVKASQPTVGVSFSRIVTVTVSS